MSTSAQITQSLTTLLSRAPPPKLISVTESLVSLSRQRAPTLKPEEEIARLHACAEIACKRSRVSLRLPAVRSGAGAPCRPAAYGKLVRLLEGVLGDGLPGTPGKRATPTSTGKRTRNVERESGDEDEEVDTPSRKRQRGDAASQSGPATPSKSARKQSFLDAVKGASSKSEKSRKQSKSASEDNVPEYVMPAIRKLCSVFSTPQLAPHVYTGLCIISGLAKLEPKDDDEDMEAYKVEVMSLIIALYLIVLTRMQKGKMTNTIYSKVTAKSLEVLGLGNGSSQDRKIKAWINKVNEEGWVQGQDWWDTVPEGVISGPRLTTKKIDDSVNVEDGEQDVLSEDDVGLRNPSIAASGGEERRAELLKNLSEEDPEDVLLPGLGTMMDDSVDYFNEDRLMATAAWTKNVLARIAKLSKIAPSVLKSRPGVAQKV